MLQICFCVYLVCPLERHNALAEALGGEDDLESKTVTSLKLEFLASVFTRADDVNSKKSNGATQSLVSHPMVSICNSPHGSKRPFEESVRRGGPGP